MKKNSGYGLVELIIAVGIFSVVGFVFLSWHKIFIKTSGNIDQKINLVTANKIITEQLDCCRTYIDYFGPNYTSLLPLNDASFTVPVVLKNSHGENIASYTKPWNVEGRPGGIALNIFYGDERYNKKYIERQTSAITDRKEMSGENENLKCQYNVNHCSLVYGGTNNPTSGTAFSGTGSAVGGSATSTGGTSGTSTGSSTGTNPYGTSSGSSTGGSCSVWTYVPNPPCPNECTTSCIRTSDCIPFDWVNCLCQSSGVSCPGSGSSSSTGGGACGGCANGQTCQCDGAGCFCK